MCQDALELFFGMIRSRLGHNNNPNVEQLEAALKIIIAVRIKARTTGNCSPFEEDGIPHLCPLSVAKEKKDKKNNSQPILESDLIEEYPDLPTFENLSLFVSNVVTYVSGFVGRKLLAKTKCSACAFSLISKNIDIPIRSDYLLISEKQRGGLYIPSSDVIEVCRISESVIREEHAKGVRYLNSDLILRKSMRIALDSELLFDDLRKVVTKDHTLFGPHVSNLIRNVIKEYTKIRLHHIARETTMKISPECVRNQNNKLTI